MTQDSGKTDRTESRAETQSIGSLALHHWERNRLIRGAKLPCRLKAILQEINDQQDLDYFAPTIESIAECAGLSERRTRAAMQKLRNMGLVTTTPTRKYGGGRGPDDYEIDFDEVARLPRVKFGRHKRTRAPKQFTRSLFPDERPDETTGLQDVTKCQGAPTERPDETSGLQAVTNRPGGPDETTGLQDRTNRPGLAVNGAREAAAALHSRLVKLGIFPSKATEFVENVPHDYLAQVIQEFETHGAARGLGAGALAEAIRRREHIAPPYSKPSKTERAEQKRRADLEAEKAKRETAREQAEREQAQERALRERWRELPDAERESIRVTVRTKNPLAREWRDDSDPFEKLCLAEFEQTYSAEKQAGNLIAPANTESYTAVQTG